MNENQLRICALALFANGEDHPLGVANALGVSREKAVALANAAADESAKSRIGNMESSRYLATDCGRCARELRSDEDSFHPDDPRRRGRICEDCTRTLEHE